MVMPVFFLLIFILFIPVTLWYAIDYPCFYSGLIDCKHAVLAAASAACGGNGVGLATRHCQCKVKFLLARGAVRGRHIGEHGGVGVARSEIAKVIGCLVLL